MKIKEIEIKNFGKFSNQRFVFRDGIQVFYGEMNSESPRFTDF